MKLQIEIIGYLLVVLTCMHAFFPAYFKWNQELKTLSLINRQMLTIHTLFIALGLLLMGLLCLSSASELVQTTLGKRISLGLGLFWVIRLWVQFFGYSRELWQGKKFETSVHIVFALLWGYFSFVFLANYYS